MLSDVPYLTGPPILLAWLYNGKHASWWFDMGLCLLSNFLFSILLKYIIRAPRPLNDIKTGPGFPSSHMQWMSCLAYLLTQTPPILQLSPPVRYPIVVFGVLSAVAVGYDRIYIGVHSPVQVLGGAILGLCFPAWWLTRPLPRGVYAYAYRVAQGVRGALVSFFS